MLVKPKTKKESKEVYFLIIDKENNDFHNPENKNSPKCIFTKENNKGDNIKIFKYSVVEKEKKKNSVEPVFINKDNEKFIVNFDIKESTFVYNLDFKKDRNFYKSKKIIEQNIENYEKMNYYIESLNESKEENKLNILFNDSINIYSKKPRFEFLVNIFIHVYNDENLCSKLLSEFDKNYTKEEQKNSIFPENLEKYLKNFNDICENIVNFNSSKLRFYGIIFCYLNNVNKEKFIEMFKKIYEKDKKILFHILSKYKYYFKNEINMEINYLNELIDFSTSLEYEEFKENVIFYLRGINTFLKVIDNNKEKISIIEKFHPIEFPKIELESQANINEIIELINEIIEFSEEKKVLVVYFTNDFWDEMLKHCSSFNKDNIEKKRNNIEECFNLREKFVNYYKLVQLKV